MKRTPKCPSRLRPAIFSSRLGVDGGFHKSQVVDLRTGKVIAAVPRWYSKVEAKRSANQLVKALHTFYYSGGYFPTDYLSYAEDLPEPPVS